MGSGDCTFFVNYTDYASFIEVDNTSEIPYIFKMTLSATVYTNSSSDLYVAVVEERDILVCVPAYRLRDRIVCENGLKWFEPSWNSDYECDSVDDVESVG